MLVVMGYYHFLIFGAQTDRIRYFSGVLFTHRITSSLSCLYLILSAWPVGDFSHCLKIGVLGDGFRRVLRPKGQFPAHVYFFRVSRFQRVILWGKRWYSLVAGVRRLILVGSSGNRNGLGRG